VSGRGPVFAAACFSTESMTKLRSSGWFTTSPAIAPHGESPLLSGNVGAATT
jgi:hypothetical protein